MRVLWISCLLIGSITCGPVGKGYRANMADTVSMQQPFSTGHWFSGTGVSSGLDSSLPLPSLSYASSNAPSTNMADAEVFRGYTSFRDEGYNPEGGDYGVASQSAGYVVSAPAGSYGGYDSSAGAYDGSYGFVMAPQDEDQSSGSVTSYGVEENPEPVFSDVSDLEPVYSFSSRSSYQRGRAVFAQTRYTPGEPVPPVMPEAPRRSRITSTQSSPKGSYKGDY